MRTLNLIFLLLAASVANVGVQAHEGRPIYIEITEQQNSVYSLQWKIPPVAEDGKEPLIKVSGNGCQLDQTTRVPALAGAQSYICEGRPTTVELRYSGANPVLSSLILMRTLDGNEMPLMSGPDELVIPLPEAETFWSVAKRYALTGADHILEGYDHLLFVLCLMFMSGGPRRILITVTGFTLGHSITLGTSALAGWSLPPTFVEPLIAFSIVMLAAEVARGDKSTLAYRYPALVASGFGLLHGFGFGGALAEIGLPYGLKLQALAFFNIGVEVGQILFVVIAGFVFLAIKRAAGAVSRMPSPAQLRTVAIYPAGLIAAYWTFERTIGIWQ